MQRIVLHALVICLAFIGMAAAAAATGGIRIEDAWARATPPGVRVGAAYLLLTNQGGQDRLLSVSTPIAERAEMHITTMEDGMMRMRPMRAVDLAGGETVRFVPGGRHFMLIGLEKPLREGDSFPLTLTFEKADPIETTVQVRRAKGAR